MTEMDTNTNGTIIPFPIDRIDPSQRSVEVPNVFFDLIITLGNQHRVLVTTMGTQYDDIHRSIVQGLADTYSVLADAMEFLGAEGRVPVLSIRMDVGGEQTTDVGPAISQLAFIGEFSKRDRRSSERFPDKITSELLSAMARSHFAIIGKEAAETELALATKSLNSAMLLHGMIEIGGAE